MIIFLKILHFLEPKTLGRSTRPGNFIILPNSPTELQNDINMPCKRQQKTTKDSKMKHSVKQEIQTTQMK